MKNFSHVSVFALALSFATGLGVVTTSTSAEASPADAVLVTTLGVSNGNIDCTRTNNGWTLEARAAVVRGHHQKIRIVRNFVDVAVESVSVDSCNDKCSPSITHKGNADGKGFVEVDVDIKDNAPTGNATLVLHYPLGVKGEYKLLIVANSSVTSIDHTTDGASEERYTFHGTGLDRIQNHFSASRTGAGGFGLSRASASSSTLVLDRTEKNCTAGTFELDLALDEAPSCRIRDVHLPVRRDDSCAAGGNAPPPVNPFPHGPPGSSVPSTPNLLPSVSTPTVLTRALGPAVSGMVPVNGAFCAGLPVNVASTVAVPALTWGVIGTNIEQANQRFDVQLIDADSNRVLDTLTLANGFPASTPLVTKNNYPGRPTTLRVISNPHVGSVTTLGCFTAPGAAQTLDPKNLLVRVDPANTIAEGSRENDNDLRF